jgi:poly-gamma-glutamate synthesis protein (capsule biosynthesis protein)
MKKTTYIYIIFIFLIGLIFYANAQVPEQVAKQDSTLSVIVSGDLMLGGRFIEVMSKQGIDYPLQQISKTLQLADITYCNMEPPFRSDEGKSAPKQYIYRVPPEHSKSIKNAGFDVVALANNHIMDYGVKALQTTLKTLDHMDIQYCGAGMNLAEARKPVIMEKNGVKIGFLSYSKTFPFSFYAKDDEPGTAPGYEQYLREDIPKLKEQVDFVIVSFYWASIMQKDPKKYQVHLARQSINLGADIIIGHHPYTIQPLEIYKGKPIFYSVGKLAFGSLSNSLQESLLLKFFLSNQTIDSIHVMPVMSNNHITNFQPRLMEEENSINFLKTYFGRGELGEKKFEIIEGVGRINFRETLKDTTDLREL